VRIHLDFGVFNYVISLNFKYFGIIKFIQAIKLPNGYMGKILRVDLTAGTLRDEPISNDVAKKYLGGKGYSVYLLYQYLKEYESKGISAKDINPLGPENVMIFATGPGTGVPGFPSPGRYHVMTLRSPLSSTIGSGNSGG